MGMPSVQPDSLVCAAVKDLKAETGMLILLMLPQALNWRLTFSHIQNPFQSVAKRLRNQGHTSGKSSAQCTLSHH